MKKLFLSLIILASVSFTAFSQNSGSRRDHRQNVMKELNLTTDQQQKMKSLNEDFKAKMDTLRSDASLSKESKREKMKELFDTRSSDMQALLTPEQQAKMKDIRVKREGMFHKGNQKFSQHAKRFTAMRDSLNLSDEQKNQMRSANESFKSQMQGLRADTSLSKDARMAKIKSLATAYKEQLNSILTPEQQAKMKDNFKNGCKNFNKYGKFQGRKGRGGFHHKFDAETMAQLRSLKENFVKQKEAIKRSRIAPDAQKERIKELVEKYRTDRKAILGKAMDKIKSNRIK